MKKIKSLLLVLVSLALAACGGPERNTLTVAETVAQNATSCFLSRDDAEFYLLLDSNLKSRLEVQDLTRELDEINHIYGKPLEVSDPVSISENINTASVDVPVRFTSGWYDFEYTVNASGSITAFKIVASDMEDESGYNEVRGTYAISTYRPSYIYTVPNTDPDTCPLVIFVHSREMYDRNGTIGINRIFRLLAQDLADEGIASVRYDRVLQNASDEEDSHTLILEELKAVMEELKDQKILENRKVFVLGYSLGGYLLPWIAQNIEADGYVIACAPAIHYPETVYNEQVYLIENNDSYSDGVRQQKLQQASASLDIINNLTTIDDYKYTLFGYPSEFWLFVNQYEPLRDAEKIGKPLMIFAGSNDYVVSVEHYNNWNNAVGDVAEMKLYKDMDHLMMIRNTPSAYSDRYVQGSLAPAMVKDLSGFIHANGK